jgi:hypothetical protein
MWLESFFPMDPDKLKRRLERGRLILGDTKETVPKFMPSDVSPVAFSSF